MTDSLHVLWLIPLVVLVAGSIVYCVLAIAAAVGYRNTGSALLRDFPPVSVLRPMAGDRDNTEEALRSVFEQDYPDFEVILGASSPDDPAVPIAQRIMAAYPQRPSRLIFTGESPHPNRKVWQLRALWDEAAHETIVMADSDIGWASDCLKTVVSELAQEGVGLVTCPYRAVAGPSFWSHAEVIGLNVDFISGMLTARLLNGMDYAIGCTIATRRQEIDAIGGLRGVQPYLSEDFVIGNRIHNAGRTVILSRSVIEHYIGNRFDAHQLDAPAAMGTRIAAFAPCGLYRRGLYQADSARDCVVDSGPRLGRTGGAGAGNEADCGVDRGSVGSGRPGGAAALVAAACGRCLRVRDVGAGVLWEQPYLARPQDDHWARRHD